MRLKEAASSPNSSCDSTSTLAARSPAATRRAASASETTGRVTRAANHKAGENGDQNSEASDQHRGRDDAALEFDQRTARTADQQHAHELLIRAWLGQAWLSGAGLVGTVKWDRVKCLCIGSVATPMDGALLFLPGAANLFDQRCETIGAGGGAVQVEQQLRVPFRIEVLVQQNARACGDVERRKKLLIEPFAANDEQGLFADVDGADSKQAESRAIWQVFALEERSRGAGRGGDGGFVISKLRLPLSGRENGSLMVDEFEEVELLLRG